MGQVICDAIANAATLLDGLVLIGGGLSGAYEFFMPEVMEELNGIIDHLNNTAFLRMANKPYFLQEENINEFVNGYQKTIEIPFSNKTISYDTLPRIGIGLSQLGVNKAIALGTYVFAVSQ